MLVNYDSNPKNSIIYTSAVILEYLKSKKGINLNELSDYCLERGMEYYLIFLSVDWLYLIGVIREISKEGLILYEIS